MAKDIVVIVGSLRKESFNRKVGQRAAPSWRRHR